MNSRPPWDTNRDLSKKKMKQKKKKKKEKGERSKTAHKIGFAIIYPVRVLYTEV